MQVSYNAKAKRFEVKCTFAENRLIAGLPNKRFRPRSKTWHASTMAATSSFLLDNLKDSMTPEAVEIAEKSLERATIKRKPFPGWYEFQTIPFEHQQEALDRIWGLNRYALFMEMGTGKSKVACDYNAATMLSGSSQVWVIFCPNSVKENWEQEISVHFPIPDIPVYTLGALSKSQRKRIQQDADNHDRYVVIAAVESLQQKFRGGQVYDDLISLVGNKKYTATVDESHLIKNCDATRSKNITYICEYAVACGIMTGTPVTQSILDLYSQFLALDPAIIGTDNYYSFRNRYAQMGGFENKQVVGYQNVEELMDLVSPYIYQCTKEVLDLPEKLYTTRSVKMSDEQRRVYAELDFNEEAFIGDLSKNGTPVEVIVDMVLTKYNALQQVTGGFVNYDEDTEDDTVRRTAWIVEPEKNPKVRALIEVAEENGNKPIIVWAKFRNEIKIIVEALEAQYGKGSTAEFHGGVKDRKEELTRFKTGQARFFVANQQTGGTGLTINEANVVVYFSNSLKMVDRLQSEDRNHRIGQKNHVLYVDLVCSATRDVDILRALKMHQDVADFVKSEIGSRTNGS